ncbi:Crp/Fnr family transcriptional regulator [Sphingobium chlorophenolicum]|nr:Crp/Fnr family transcriptional regulator [Sphingobium chlorophenolicum]
MNDSIIAVKLSAHWPLDRQNREAINRLVGRSAIPRRTGTDLFAQGDRLTSIFFLLEGWGARYKMLADGRRQIVSLLLPGDLCDPFCFLLHRADHGVAALTPIKVAEVGRGQFEEVALERPEITKAMWINALITASIQREWCVNLGRRTALERLSHLFCELYHRLCKVGMVTDAGFHFPVTQLELADATGLTMVHTNRILQEMRRKGLIELQRRHLIVPDLAALERICAFDPSYLHPAAQEAL